MNATRAISAARIFIFLMASLFLEAARYRACASRRACIRSRSFLQSRFNDIHESLHTQGNVDLLAIDEKRRHCFYVGLSGANHVLENPVPELGRTRCLHERIRVHADTAWPRGK